MNFNTDLRPDNCCNYACKVLYTRDCKSE